MEALATQQKQIKTSVPARRPPVSQDGQHAEVRAVLRRSNFQAKLRVGQPDDPYEKEADRIANQVVDELRQGQNSLEKSQSSTRNSSSNEILAGMPHAQQQSFTRQISKPIKSTALDVQHLSTNNEDEMRLRPDEEGEEHLHVDDYSLYTVSIGRRLAADIAAIRQGGMPLMHRESYETHFGRNFSETRVHSDRRANNLAARLGARAFTYGNHIVFGPGQYAPQNETGQRLIAHELTHVVQQGAAGKTPHYSSDTPGRPNGNVSPIAAYRKSKTLQDTPKLTDTSAGMSSAEVPNQAQFISPKTQAPQLQAGLLDDASDLWDQGTDYLASGARRVGRTVVRGARVVGETVVSGAQAVVETAEDVYESVRGLVLNYLEENAPGLLAFLRGDIIGEIKQRVFEGLDYLFNGFGQRIQREGLVSALRGAFGEFMGTVAQIAGDLSNGNCGSLFEALNTIAAFGERLMGPAFDEIRALLSEAGTFFGDLWSKFGAPGVEIISDLAGSAWTWISEQAQWLWDQTAGVRGLIAGAWDEFKRLFNIAWGGAGDVLTWLRDKAQEAWEAIKEELGPYLLPLQIAVGVFALFTPLGPVVAIGVGGPLLWQGINWLRENWDDIGIIVRAREILHNQIIPGLQAGLEWFQSVLQNAADWLSDIIARISVAVTSLLAALGVLPVLRVLFGVVSRLADKVIEAASWFIGEFVVFLRDLKQMAIDFLTFIRPIAILIGAILIFPINPFVLAIVLTGWAWRIAPDCVKPPIIEFFIDSAIAVIRAMPDFANFGDVWPRAKEKIIESLEIARAQPMERKIEMSNRVAKMMTGEDFSWIGNLIQAAREMPDHFWGQAQEELIGMDLTQPLPFERTENRTQNTAELRRVADRIEPGLEQRLLRGALTDGEVEIDRVATTTWNPEVVERLNMPDNGVYYIGEGLGEESDFELGAVGPESAGLAAGGGEDIEARLQAMMDQPIDMPCEQEQPSGPANGEQPASGQEFPEAMKFGPLTQGQRARYLLDRMGKGIGHWFDCNKHWVVPSIILAIVALIVLEIVTEGAITAALPAIAEIMGLIFAGIAFVRVAYYLGEYLTLGVIGQTTDAAKALARGIAVGAIELVFALLFNIDEVIKTARQGVRATTEAAIGSVRGAVTRGVDAASDLGRTFARGARATARNVQRAGRATIRTGRVIVSGVQDGIGRAAHSIGELLRRLRNQLREFRGFRFKRQGRWLLLQALFNPWVTIARGRVQVVDEGIPRAIFLTDEELALARRGGDPGPGAVRPFETDLYNATRAPRRGQPTGTGGRRGLVGDRLTGDHIPSRAALHHALLEARAGRQLTRAEARSVWNSLTDAEQQAIRHQTLDEGVTVVLSHTDHSTLSRTYSGRNTDAQILRDGRDLGGAFQRDAEAILRGLYDDGRLTPEIVGAYMRAYRDNVRRGVFRYNPDVDEMMRDFLQRLHRRGSGG